MIRTVIKAAISNYALTCLLLGLIVSAAAIARAPRPVTTVIVVDRLLAWYVLLTFGVMYIVNFVFQLLFGQIAATFIGWADSPFQLEIGTASLGSRQCWHNLLHGHLHSAARIRVAVATRSRAACKPGYPVARALGAARTNPGHGDVDA
jgi:hypothetical protein